MLVLSSHQQPKLNLHPRTKILCNLQQAKKNLKNLQKPTMPMALFKNKLPQTTILMVLILEVGRTSNASVESLHPLSVFIMLAVGAVGTLNA